MTYFSIIKLQQVRAWSSFFYLQSKRYVVEHHVLDSESPPLQHPVHRTECNQKREEGDEDLGHALFQISGRQHLSAQGAGDEMEDAIGGHVQASQVGRGAHGAVLEGDEPQLENQLEAGLQAGVSRLGQAPEMLCPLQIGPDLVLLPGVVVAESVEDHCGG